MTTPTQTHTVLGVYAERCLILEQSLAEVSKQLAEANKKLAEASATIKGMSEPTDAG